MLSIDQIFDIIGLPVGIEDEDKLFALIADAAMMARSLHVRQTVANEDT